MLQLAAAAGFSTVSLFFAFFSPPFEVYALRPYYTVAVLYQVRGINEAGQLLLTAVHSTEVMRCATIIVNKMHSYDIVLEQGRDDTTLFSLRKQAKCMHKKMLYAFLSSCFFFAFF